MQNSRGFTLIELIMVIILIGVVSAAASSLFTRTSNFSAVAARDQMIAIATVALLSWWLLAARAAFTA